MASFYANRIKTLAKSENPFTIDNVPDLWKQTTLNKLKEWGLDGYGNKLPVE